MYWRIFFIFVEKGYVVQRIFSLVFRGGKKFEEKMKMKLNKRFSFQLKFKDVGGLCLEKIESQICGFWKEFWVFFTCLKKIFLLFSLLKMKHLKCHLKTVTRMKDIQSVIHTRGSCHRTEKKQEKKLFPLKKNEKRIQIVEKRKKFWLKEF